MLRESELDLWMWAEGDWHLHPLQCVFSFHQCVRSPLLFFVTAFKLRSKDLRISTLLKFFCFIWIVPFFYSTTFHSFHIFSFIIVLVFYASVLFSYLLNFSWMFVPFLLLSCVTCLLVISCFTENLCFTAFFCVCSVWLSSPALHYPIDWFAACLITPAYFLMYRDCSLLTYSILDLFCAVCQCRYTCTWKDA